jgi:glycosyltransferase involved in cell wall biosynthesis
MADHMSRDLQKRVSIVVPAFNEEDGIVPSLQSLRSGLPLAEVLVVDDGSTDRTAERAAGVRGVTVIRHVFNRGYGAAIKTGVLAGERDYVAWFDADNEHRVEDLAAMVVKLDDGRLAAVIGQRTNPPSSMIRAYGKWLIRVVSGSLRMHAGPDLNCGLRVFRRDVLTRYLPVLPDGFSASLTSTMVLLERGYPTAFLPIVTAPRVGYSKVVIADGLNALVLLLRTVMLFAPLRIFMSSGLVLLAVGVLYGVGWALIFGRGFPVGAMFIATAGLFLVMLGLVADQISQLRLTALAAGKPPDSYVVSKGSGHPR